MKEAVVVSTARTPIGRAFRGALNNTKSPTMMGHAIRHAVARAGIQGEEVDDLIVGTVLSAGTAGMNVARQAGLAGGLPVTVSAQTMDRQCSSGLMAIATAAKQIVVDGMQIVVAGGQDNKETKEVSYRPVTLSRDEGNRPDTTLANLQSLAPVVEGGAVTAGNASQLSDGASACVLMDARLAERRGLEPLGVYRGMAVAGCAPEEMGIGPIYAIPKLLKQHGLSIGDIGLWELNEAFACQVLYCRDFLDIDPARYNVNGAAFPLVTPTA